MKHKRSENAFAHYLVLITIIAGAIGFSGWYVISHKQNSDTQNITTNWLPNELSVIFKDGTTYSQASGLMKSYGLPIEQADLAENDFIPKSYRGIKADSAAVVMDKLRSYPEVKSVIDDSADPVNNRANADEKWVEIIWQENVTFERIKQIQAATGYGLSNQPQTISRSIFVIAPNGQEDRIVKKLNNEALIKTASRISVPAPL